VDSLLGHLLRDLRLEGIQCGTCFVGNTSWNSIRSCSYG